MTAIILVLLQEFVFQIISEEINEESTKKYTEG
jgi:hypothetical protein